MRRPHDCGSPSWEYDAEALDGQLAEFFGVKEGVFSPRRE